MERNTTSWLSSPLTLEKIHTFLERIEMNLDEELKMAEIRRIEQMIAESFATVEKMREDSKRADKKWEEEREQRKLENERYHKENERMQRESEARIAKYEAEREKLNKDTRYYPLIALIIAAIAAIGTILSPILWHYFNS